MTEPATGQQNGLCGTSNNNHHRQFHVLDEVTQDSDSNQSQFCDSDVPDEEIDKLLEDALINTRKKRNADEADLGKCQNN